MYDEKRNSSASLEKGLGVASADKSSVDKGLGIDATTHAAGEHLSSSFVHVPEDVYVYVNAERLNSMCRIISCER